MGIHERGKIYQELKALEEKRATALSAISQDLPDDEYDEEFERVWNQYDVSKLGMRYYAVQYKKVRNEWFKAFAQSFGLCENRRITRKQADVFVRYSEECKEPMTGRGMAYFVRVGSLFIKTMVFTQHEPGYVSIWEIE